jgi:hypothetical protein
LMLQKTVVKIDLHVVDQLVEVEEVIAEAI